MSDQQKKLVEENQRLVWNVIHRSGFHAQDPAMDMDDLFQIGCIGLIKAGERVCEGEKLFAPFACACIWNAIAMELRKYQAKSRQGALHQDSLDQLVDEETPLGNLIPGGCETPEEAVLTGSVQKIFEDFQRLEPVLAYLMLDKQITQEEAAKLMGCSQPMVSRKLKAERQRLAMELAKEGIIA